MTPLDFAKLCQESYDDNAVGFVEVEDLRFGVRDFGDVVAVVFRGSSNRPNWLRDLAAVPARSRGGHLAHYGFVGAVNTLWSAVTAQLPKEKPVIFIGHSLGGGVAVLFAEAFNAQCVTFGCPRVWWLAEEPPAVNHIRIVCDDDPVPMVPHFLFRHDCEPLLTLIDPGTPIDPADHCIDHYVERLEASYGMA